METNTIPKGELYLEAVESSLSEAYEEEQRGGDLVLNSYVLCIDIMTEKVTHSYYDEETGEEVEYEDEDERITGHKFVITTGGPHAEFRTTDNGENWTFHYWDWFGSDLYETEVPSSMCEPFMLWFECGVPQGQQLGEMI